MLRWDYPFAILLDGERWHACRALRDDDQFPDGARRLRSILNDQVIDIGTKTLERLREG